MHKKLTGRWGEIKAAEYLKKRRYKVIGMNYSCRHGEIDIIAKNKEFLVFVEVKLRKNDSFAQAMEYVTLSKQKKIITAARHWLSENPTELQPRFDVIEIYAPEGSASKEIKINHIENAFM
ncbi:MAG TPA: YraN family protein [Clostridiales bacterium]|nr:YraN family protein [Clostridiales bacterium]